MIDLKATIRKTKTTGQVNKLRSSGFIPAILYGGSKENLNIQNPTLSFAFNKVFYILCIVF